MVLVSVHLFLENKRAEGLLNNYSNSYDSKGRLDFGKKQIFKTKPILDFYRNYYAEKYFVDSGVRLVRLIL